MRPVADQFPVTQEFASMATAGVIGNINASTDTVEYWVGRYGNYQPFGHAGMDFGCPIGTPIRAMADGIVLYAGWSDDLPGDESWGPSGYFRRWALYKYFPGIVTVIQHTGWIGVYAHQSDNNAVKVGQHVKEGQIIGKTGNTSSRTTRLDAHLHVEALVDLNYPSYNGLIYGRTNPRKFFGSGLAPQSTTINKGGFLMALSDAQQQEIYTKIHRYLDAPTGAIPEKSAVAVWNQTVLRGGQNISVKQELADAKTLIQGLQAAVQALAKNPNLTAAQITEAVAAGVVTVDVKINGKEGA